MKNTEYFDYLFQNLQETDMSFEHVFARIGEFMRRNPSGNYRLMFGTDSQVHARKTLFVTAIVIHCEGKGAWGCIREVTIPRAITSLYEKISYETTLTESVVSLFDEYQKSQLIDIVLPYVYQGASFTIEGHIDVGQGKRSKTSIYAKEMMARIRSMGIEPKIKPYAYVASGYANRYTK